MTKQKRKKPIFNYQLQNKLINLYHQESKTRYYAVIAGHTKLLVEREWLFDELVSFMDEALHSLYLRTVDPTEHDIIYNSEVIFNAAIAVYRYNIKWK